MSVTATFPLATPGGGSSAATSAANTELEQITDHAERAVDRLPQQHHEKVNLPEIVRILAAPFQELEDVFWALFTERSVDKAVGAQLTILGKIVGQARAGLADDVYRRYIRARISANKSDGSMEDVIRVLSLVVNDDGADIEISLQPPAAFVARVSNVALAASSVTALNDLLQDAKSAGVRAIIEYYESTANLFTLDSGPGLDQGNFAGAV